MQMPARISGRINSRLIIFRIIIRLHSPAWQPPQVPLAIQTIVWTSCFPRSQANWKERRDATGWSFGGDPHSRELSSDVSYLKHIRGKLRGCRMNAAEGGTSGGGEHREGLGCGKHFYSRSEFRFLTALGHADFAVFLNFACIPAISAQNT